MSCNFHSFRLNNMSVLDCQRHWLRRRGFTKAIRVIIKILSSVRICLLTFCLILLDGRRKKSPFYTSVTLNEKNQQNGIL